ncbi:CHC2 zinc finger domain-containing protein [Pararhodobacter sp.]|uniref:DUF7146 domain-containing protein n=1 Tax=Pararhodobacter sp. TaxID=2127056 RepID=UPI002B003309|nr:CHC2 zinc finger domain-containing protein [Pararhodobacter sp.]
MTPSADFEAWVAEARAVRVEDVIARRGIPLRRQGPEMIGPCPVCGGRKRFSVNASKNIWICRDAGRGGDAIALVEYLDDADFLGACETLTGRAPPRGEGQRASPEELAAREEERRKREAVERAKRERASNKFRADERDRLLVHWRHGLPLKGSMAEVYLREVRKLDVPEGAHLLFAPDLPYFGGQEEDERGRKRPRRIGSGPAMLAAITDGAGAFRGLHMTWLDLSRPKGKAEFADPETGEILPAKKCRGSVLGGRIVLVPAGREPQGQCSGEGIETTLAMWSALRRNGGLPEGWLWAAGITLGNLTGKAVETVRHPTEVRETAKGHKRAVKVPGPVPDMSEPAMPVPASVAELVLLADGDSEPFFTRNAMARAEARHAREGLRVATYWPRVGADCNDMIGEDAA